MSTALQSIVKICAIFTLVLFCNHADANDIRTTNTAHLGPIMSLLLEEEPITLTDASRFLTQATYGPKYEEIIALSKSSYAQWIDQQLTLPPTLHMDTGIRIGFFDRNGGALHRNLTRVSVWIAVAMEAPDQLRQRTAFALSQIFVVNDKSPEQASHIVVNDYYDLLVKNAFGNYREVLEKVTLNGVMGHFLGMAGNQRSNQSLNILRPDENFAREVLQLFSIGLDELNLDGTPKLNAEGQTIPTYNQKDIQQFAKVFTGWHYDYISTATFQQRRAADLKPMRAFDMYHDKSSKRLLKVPTKSHTLPANQTAERDLKDALDIIFNHPNVGPFIGKQLIQRFVTSNPSPAYVSRIASVFNDNGRGVRGDLAAVIRAILLDSEARQGHLRNPRSFGKIREPILRATALWRGVGFLMKVPFIGPSSQNLFLLKQAPLQASSVFNFYRPDHSPAGKLAKAGLLSPESQQLDIASMINMGKAFHDFSLRSNHEQNPNNASFTPINTLSLIPLVPDNLMQPEELIDRLNITFLSGKMPLAMRQILLDLHKPDTGYAASNKLEIVSNMLYLITLSPYFIVQ